jgi:hypothetical protein
MVVFSTAIRKEFTRRAQSASAQVHERMAKAEQMLQEHINDQKHINAGMFGLVDLLWVYHNERLYRNYLPLHHVSGSILEI